MPTYGRQLLGTTGQPIAVTADGSPEWKSGGITLDWSTVAAVGADTLLPDGVTIPNGQKGLRYGQILCMIGVSEVQTVTVTATGGTMTLSLVDPRDGTTKTTIAVAYNATAAVVEAALATILGPNKVVVTLAGGVYTLTFDRSLGDVAQVTVGTAALTGGTATPATTTAGTASGGKFGPYDPSATDGRQTLAKGFCGVLNETLLQSGIIAALGAGYATDHPGLIVGGRVYRDRLLATSDAAGSLATGPTFANLDAAMPRLSYAQ